MTTFTDDKCQHCIPFVLDLIKKHRDYYITTGDSAPPFFIGLNGVQGVGKTTLVSYLKETLSSSPHNLPTVVLSIDDLYLPHRQQKALAASQPNNPLVQHRGEPSTHDVTLGVNVFKALAERQLNVRVPSYDKSKYNGAGDRRPESEWELVNTDGQKPIEVVIFEGWCVGFRPLNDTEIERKWRDANTANRVQPGIYSGQLGKLELEHVMFINEKLKDYDVLTDKLHAFIHIDAEDTQFVYAWRLEQEVAMRKSTGMGLSEEQVRRFVDGYYPAYELYVDVLRHGIFDIRRKQLRLVVGKDRRVVEIFHI